MACDFPGGLHVDLPGGRLGVAVFAISPGIDVDGDQRLGLIDHERAARGKLNAAGVYLLDLALQAICVKQTVRLGVQLEIVPRARHHRPEKLIDSSRHRLGVADDPVNVTVVHVSDCARHKVRLLVNFRGSLGVFDAPAYRLPKRRQVVQIALELALGVVHPGGAKYKTHLVRKLQRAEYLPRLVAQCLVLDLARYT